MEHRAAGPAAQHHHDEPARRPAFKWSDYAIEVDLNDPFFQVLEVSTRVNADFANLPIFTVEVKLSYPGVDVREYTFSGPDDVGKFRAPVINGNRKYKYVYQVNYKGDSRVFSSEEVETDDTQLTINVDDLGILVVDIARGGHQLLAGEAGTDPGPLRGRRLRQPVEQQFTMTEQQREFKIREVIFTPRTEPIHYDVKFFMADGREFEIKDKTQDSPQISINDPFSAPTRRSGCARWAT